MRPSRRPALKLVLLGSDRVVTPKLMSYGHRVTFVTPAVVAELVDAHVSGTCVFGRGSSSLPNRINVIGSGLPTPP